VTDETRWREVDIVAEAQFGRLDILVSNAAIVDRRVARLGGYPGR